MYFLMPSTIAMGKGLIFLINVNNSLTKQFQFVFI